MTAWENLKGSWEEFIALKHLPEREAINTRMLLHAYVIVIVCSGLLMGLAMMRFGVDGRGFKILTQVFALGFMTIMMDMTRRGRGLLAAWGGGTFLLCLVVQRCVEDGGLNAIVCVLMIPIAMMSFMHASRSIFAYAAIAYAVVMSTSAYLYYTPIAGIPAPRYDFNVAALTFSIILFNMVSMTWLAMRNQRHAVALVSKSTHELELMQHEAIAQSVEAERGRHEALLNKRAKARYLANMSHELRTPLSTIISYSELLDESLSDFHAPPEHIQHDVVHVKAAGEHLLRRLNDILDLSRLEAGKMPIHSEQIYLKNLLTKTRNFAKARALSDHAHRLKVSWPKPESYQHIKVCCDELLTTKLLAHLLLHLRQDGPISMFIKPHETSCELVFKLKFWTSPPAAHDIKSLNSTHLHLLLYRTLVDTLGLKAKEPDQASTTHTWSITLNLPES